MTYISLSFYSAAAVSKYFVRFLTLFIYNSSSAKRPDQQSFKSGLINSVGIKSTFTHRQSGVWGRLYTSTCVFETTTVKYLLVKYLSLQPEQSGMWLISALMSHRSKVCLFLKPDDQRSVWMFQRSFRKCLNVSNELSAFRWVQSCDLLEVLQQLHAPWRLFAATDLFRVFSVSVSAASCPSLKTDVWFCSDGFV